MELMKTVRWALGAIILGALIALIVLKTPPFLSYRDLPYFSFLGKALFIILLAALMCLYRVWRGPTAADRIVAVDIFGLMLVGVSAILTVVTGRSWYIDIGIAWALQAFVMILVLSKYLEGKGFDE
jgi:multicomponent Na+:H+ antiporter subunit F